MYDNKILRIWENIISPFWKILNNIVSLYNMYVQNKKKYQLPKNSYSYPNNKNAI